jgi:hypothetical protein
MRDITVSEVQEVSGGSFVFDVAAAWVGTVAGVGLAVVGAPVLVGAAVTLGLTVAIAGGAAAAGI